MITKKQFEELYAEHSLTWEEFTSEPASDQDLLENYLPSKLWRLNNLYTIVNKDGERIPFVMNLSQHKVYAASLQHSRVIILKSRQQGISTFWLISFFDDALFMSDMNCGLMAQGKAEASTLLKRIGIAWDNFPEAFKEFFSLQQVKATTEELGWNTGSTLFIRTSFRSATLQRLHISEYGKIAKIYPERAKEVKTGTLQAIKPGNTAVIESTAEGINDFKRMWDAAVASEQRISKCEVQQFSGKEFKPVFLSWLDDPDCWSEYPREASTEQLKYFEELEALTGRTIVDQQRWFWLDQYRELGEDIYQEYPATPDEAFRKTNDGAFYARQFNLHVVRNKRLIPGLYDPNLPVHVALDLGISATDYFVLVYFQRFREEWRLVQEYTNTGEGLEHYVEHMKSTGYNIGTIVAPHDLKVRELGTGISRKQRLLELGVHNLRVLPLLPIADGIEAFRRIIPNLYVDPDTCPYLIACIQNYSKEWDERNETWKRTPLHNKWSHGADALRVMAMSKLAEASVDEPFAPQANEVYDGMAF